METNRIALALSSPSVVAVLGLGSLAWSLHVEVEHVRAPLEAGVPVVECEVARLRRVTREAGSQRGDVASSSAAEL